MNYLIKINLSITLVLATINLSYAGECSQLDGLPDLDLPFGITKFLKKKKKNEDNSSCKMIDNDPLYQDRDFQKKFCKKGCSAQITDDQKKVYMTEMASPDAKKWHSNWHTISEIYSDYSISSIRDAINIKNPTNQTSSEKPIELADLKDLSEKEILRSIHKSQGEITQWLLSGDIPSQCHETISVEARKPKKPWSQNAPKDSAYDLSPELEYSPSYQECVDKSWLDDLKKFIVKNQNAGGENFLYMHHSMRNQVQMMLSKAKLPCIAGWSDIPGPDGKTGNKEGDWEEIWNVDPDEGHKLFSKKESEEMASKKFSKKEDYLKWKSDEITKLILEEKKKPNTTLDSIEGIISKNGINVMGKIFENEEFLKSFSMNEIGKLMEGTIHGRMHMTFDEDKSGCQYKDGSKTVDLSQPPAYCNLGSPSGAHIHATFWKLHGWCDDVIKKWMTAGDREYSEIGTTDSCVDPSCYKMKGTWSGGMPQF